MNRWMRSSPTVEALRRSAMQRGGRGDPAGFVDVADRGLKAVLAAALISTAT